MPEPGLMCVLPTPNAEQVRSRRRSGSGEMAEWVGSPTVQPSFPAKSSATYRVHVRISYIYVMARQCGIGTFVGTALGITGYIADGNPYIRFAPNITKRKWKTSPAYAGQRHAARVFSAASVLASGLWSGLPAGMKRLGDAGAFNRLVGTVRMLVEEGGQFRDQRSGCRVGDVDGLRGLDLNVDSMGPHFLVQSSGSKGQSLTGMDALFREMDAALGDGVGRKAGKYVMAQRFYPGTLTQPPTDAGLGSLLGWGMSCVRTRMAECREVGAGDYYGVWGYKMDVKRAGGVWVRKEGREAVMGAARRMVGANDEMEYLRRCRGNGYDGMEERRRKGLICSALERVEEARWRMEVCCDAVGVPLHAVGCGGGIVWAASDRALPGGLGRGRSAAMHAPKRSRVNQGGLPERRFRVWVQAVELPEVVWRSTSYRLENGRDSASGYVTDWVVCRGKAEGSYHLSQRLDLAAPEDCGTGIYVVFTGIEVAEKRGKHWVRLPWCCKMRVQDVLFVEDAVVEDEVAGEGVKDEWCGIGRASGRDAIDCQIISDPSNRHGMVSRAQQVLNLMRAGP
jgi:hypothetical protein